MTLLDPLDALEQIDGRTKQADEKLESLPPMTRIHLDVVGSQGKKYKHTFVFRVPTVGDQIKIGQLQAMYAPNGTGNDINARFLVEQIAYLAVTLDKDHLPKWWKPMEMYDALPISSVFKEALDYERRFHGAATGQSESGREEGVAEEESGSEPETDDRTANDHLGRKAQTPSKRRETIVSSRG